jgi:hypothetical protein
MFRRREFREVGEVLLGRESRKHESSKTRKKGERIAALIDGGCCRRSIHPHRIEARIQITSASDFPNRFDPGNQIAQQILFFRAFVFS